MKDHLTPAGSSADPKSIPARPAQPRGRQQGMTSALLREHFAQKPVEVPEAAEGHEKVVEGGEGGEGVDHAEGTAKTRKARPRSKTPSEKTKGKRDRSEADKHS